MKKQDIINKLKSAPKGSFKSATTQTTFTSKDGQTFTKITTFVIQNNISYANRKDVKSKVETGERKEVQIPAWAESVEIAGVTLTRHKKTGELYLPLNVISQKSVVTDSKGNEIPKEYLRALQFDSKNKPSFMKIETTIRNLRNKLMTEMSDEKRLELETKLEGYKNPASIGQASFVRPKLETVIAIS